jgi:hypothetical protein
MISWLNELRELIEAYEQTPPILPWDSVAIVKREYEHLLEYMRHHYILTDLGSEGWYAEPKKDWRKTCFDCGSVYVIDGVRCGMCHDGL